MNSLDERKSNRRSFLKGTMYVVPVILTLKAKSAFASLGSSRPGRLGDEPQEPHKPVGDQGGPGGGRVSWADDFGGGNGRSEGRTRGTNRERNQGSPGSNDRRGNRGGRR